MKLGAGKLAPDALLFAGVDGALPSQKRVSKAWSDFADRVEMPDIGFHSLRHTHASQLIDAGVDIVTISKRLGHSKPDIRCGFMRTCLGRTTARQPPRSMRL